VVQEVLCPQFIPIQGETKGDGNLQDPWSKKTARHNWLPGMNGAKKSVDWKQTATWKSPQIDWPAHQGLAKAARNLVVNAAKASLPF